MKDLKNSFAWARDRYGERVCIGDGVLVKRGTDYKYGHVYDINGGIMTVGPLPKDSEGPKAEDMREHSSDEIILSWSKDPTIT